MRGPRYGNVRPTKPAPAGFAADLGLTVRELMRKYSASETLVQRWIGEAELAQQKGTKK